MRRSGRIIWSARRSSGHQVLHTRESSAQQYAMRDRLTALGWSLIETIDDDLGRSAAGGLTRTGCNRMVAEVCPGKVGAVAAREVSRFVRNSRDWQLANRIGAGGVVLGALSLQALLSPAATTSGVDPERMSAAAIASPGLFPPIAASVPLILATLFPGWETKVGILTLGVVLITVNWLRMR